MSKKKDESVTPQQPFPILEEPSIVLVEPSPSHDSIKCEDWQQEPPERPWQTVRCRECNTQMWTRMPEFHDICEMCGYNIRQQIHDIEQQHIQGRGDRLLNPFDGGVFANTASIPPQEK